MTIHTSTLDETENQDEKLERIQELIPLLKAVTVMVLILNSAFNVCYGFSQGSGAGAWMIALSYGMGDAVLLCLMLFPTNDKLTKGMAILSAIGLFSLSVFSASGFLIGQQYGKDNYDVGIQRRNVEILQGVYKKHNQVQTGVRLERETAKLRAMMREKGGSGATAIYRWIGRCFNISTTSVSLAIRTLWAIVFVVAGITLSRYYGEWVGRKKKGSKRGKRSPTRDTQTSGTASTRYQQVREMVRGGELKPSVSSLVTQGMTDRTAMSYLKEMASEGLITRNGRGYHLT